MNFTKRLRAIGLASVLAISIAPSASSAANSAATEAGIGAASALTSLVYGPTKILYAATGLIIGGMAWGLSGGDGQVAHAVISPAVRGDYVVTPDHLVLEKQIEFFGQGPDYQNPYDSYTAVPATPAEVEGYASPYAPIEQGVIISEDY